LLNRPSRVTAWSVLLHDIGKPVTMTVTDRIRFSNHDRAGSVLARGIFSRLKAPNSVSEPVIECIDNHMNFMNVTKMRLSTLKRFLSRSTIEDEIDLHRVDCLASHGDVSNCDFLRKKQREIPVEEVKPDPLLTGKDLIAMGFKPGPIFGEMLDDVYDLQLEGAIFTNEEAKAWVRKKYSK
jgi:hypothetical protein